MLVTCSSPFREHYPDPYKDEDDRPHIPPDIARDKAGGFKEKQCADQNHETAPKIPSVHLLTPFLYRIIYYSLSAVNL